jgi:cation diffusion facilitator CzcD-associated flavoprotein CzcO
MCLSILEWTSAYSSQGEIWDYLKRVARKYDLYDNIKFKHQVVRMEWHEPSKKWIVVVRDKEQNTEEHCIFDIV